MIRVLDAVDRRRLVTMMAGPCSVESREQLLETAERSRRPARRSCAAARSSRAPARTRSRAGRRGAPLPGRGARRTGLPVITEVMEPNQVDVVAEYADILQIGARNMQNYSLLKASGREAGRCCSSAASARRSRSG